MMMIIIIIVQYCGSLVWLSFVASGWERRGFTEWRIKVAVYHYVSDNDPRREGKREARTGTAFYLWVYLQWCQCQCYINAVNYHIVNVHID